MIRRIQIPTLTDPLFPYTTLFRSAYRQYGTDYVSAEEQAQKDRIGMWAGSFTPPWEWRHVERQKASDTPARADCRIKGNINSRGKRLYHMPDDPSYHATRIDE